MIKVILCLKRELPGKRIFVSAKFFLIISLLFASAVVKSQVATYYAWTQSSGTYTAGVSTTSTTPANIFSTGWDDVAYNGYALPFSFTYNGTAYTNIGVDADGWITFSNGAPAMTGAGSGGSWTSLSNPTGVYLNGTANNNGFAGFNCDITDQSFATFTGTRTNGSPTITGASSTANLQIGTRLSGAGITDGTVVIAIAGTTVTMSANATSNSATAITPRASIYAFVTGTAPNRKYVIQWTQVKRYNAAGNDNFNFQLILNEGNGNPTLQTLQVVYGGYSSSSAITLDAQVGLRGASATDFNARKSTTGWAGTTVATVNTDIVRFSNTIVPASGLTYTWSPCTTPPGTAGAISGTTPVCPSTTSTYTLTAVASATTYSWTYSGTGVTFSATTGSPSNTLTFSSGATAGNLVVTPSNLCGVGGASPAFAIAINTLPTASISYPSASYCNNAAGTIAVNQTGTAGGTYSASPAGLTINAATGAVTPSTSSVAVYTVTYSFTGGGCSNTTTTSVTIKDVPNVSALPASSLICANNNVQLNAYAGTTASYTVVSVPFSNLNPSAAPTNIWTTYQDEVVSGAVAIPFNFKFYGQTITQLYAYSNGFIQLGTSSGSTGTYAQVIPNATAPNNVIALAWADLVVDPTVYSTAKVRYFTNGSAPNRMMVIDYTDLTFYDFLFGNYGNVSGQIRLYEADNHIEVAVGAVDDLGDGINKTLGIENSTGSIATAPAGRNNTGWTVSASEAWAFYPAGGTNSYLWSPSTYLSSTNISNPVATNVASTITYTVTATDTAPGGCAATTTTTVTVASPLNGTYTVGALGNYPTITAAVNAYNSLCITGPVVFSLIDPSYSTNESYPIIINNNSYSSATNTLTIKPATGVTPLITGSASSTLLQLKGADYVTIDGSNTVNGTTKDLTITNQAGYSNTVIWITSASASNGATNNTIKNCNVYGFSSTGTTACILTGSYITAGNDAEFPNSNNTIQNNILYKALNAIYQRGKTASLDQNWLITQNTIGSAVAANKLSFRGIAIINSQNFNVTQNTISGISANTSATLSGISFFLNINTGTVSHNKITDVKNAAAYGSNGIYAGATTTASNLTIANNFVFDIASYGFNGFTSVDNGYGIVLDAGGGYKLYYNTVFMNTNQTASAHRPAAVFVSSGITTASSVDMRNNMFVNAQSAGNGNSRFAILSTAANSVYSNNDYNDYVSTSGNLLCKGSNATIYTTIATLRTNLGNNLNSVSINPVITTPGSDYHIQSVVANAALSNLGTPLAGFTTDYDLTTRNGYTPDIGADEWLMPNTGSWVGKTSIDWLTDTNWETNKVPDGTTDVTITGGYTFMPTIVTTQAIRNLVLNAPVPANTPILTLNAGTLQINGTITRTAGNIAGAAGTVEMNGTAAQTIPTSLFVNNNLKNLVIGNSNAAGVTIAGTLDIYRSLTFSVSGTKLTTGNFLTFKSTASETAWLGDVTGKTIIGSATVERYIPTGINHGKTWQLLAVPVRGAQSVKASWQENNAPLVVGTANYGTTISSEKPGAVGRGYDFYTAPGPSIKTYNSATNTFVGIDNGSTATSSLSIINQKGYMVFVRGDRSVQTSAAAATPTTLRTFGPLYTATAGELPPVTTVAANKFESVGNPYASAIDFTAVTRAGGVDNVFYIWDPLLAGSNILGGYQTISSVTGYLPTPGSTNYPAATPVTKIQSGQAFFVHGTAGGNLSFTEAAKISGSQLVVRESAIANRQFLRMNLYNAATSLYGAADGNVVAFDDIFSNDFDENDAQKLINTNENAGITSNQKILAVEARRPVVNTDTIFYNLSNLRQQAYQIKFSPDGLASSGLEAWLVDRFLQTMSAVSLVDSTTIGFQVSNEPASAAADRFYLVFKKLVVVPIGITGISAERIDERSNRVNWDVENETGVYQYEVERSADGRNFQKIGTKAPLSNNGTAQHYTAIDNDPYKGDSYYRIRVVKTAGETSYSAVVKVAPLKTIASINIYPNPVVNKKINIQFSGQVKGTYQLELSNKLGELIYSTRVQVNSENVSETLQLPSYIAAGTYQLKIMIPDNANPLSKQVIIQ